MKDLEKLVEQIKKEQTIYLSSDFTKGGAIISVLFVVGAAFYIVPKLSDTSEGFQFNLRLASALLLALGGFAFFQLMYAAESNLGNRNEPSRPLAERSRLLAERSRSQHSHPEKNPK